MVLKKNNFIRGQYTPPGDKSISHRVLILSSQSVGKSKIKNLLEGQDVINTLKVMKQLGANIKKLNNQYIVYGVPPGALFQPKKKLDFGNSGTGIRLIMGLVASNNIRTILVGDKSLSNRPMKRVTNHLEKSGAIVKLRKNLYPPIQIIGSPNLIPLTYNITIPSAQIKSAIMLSALNTNGLVKIKEFKTTRNHTENMLKAMNYNIKVKEDKSYRYIEMRSNKHLTPLNYTVPGDPSSAAFFITAACMLPGSKLFVKNMLFNKTRIGFIDTLRKMGGNIKVKNIRKTNFETVADIEINQIKNLKAIVLEENKIPLQVDEIPILSIAASFALGKSVFKGLKELTVKESNRLLLIKKNLLNIGVSVEIKNSYDLHINGCLSLKNGGAKIVHHHDHRIVMSFYLANLICKKNNIIDDKSSVKTSYPTFFKHFRELFH